MSLNDIMSSGLIPGTGTPSSSTNTSSSGSSGAGNLNSLIDAFIWQTVHSSPSTMTWYAAFAIMIEGMLLGLVLMNVWRYYMFFGRSDHWLILTSIGVGACLSVAQMGVNCHQVRELIIHAAVDYSSIARADAWQTLAVTFVTAHFNAAATSFYSWRAWKLSGRKRIMIAPLCLGIVTSYALVWPVVIQGARFPEININNAKKLFDWLMLDAKLIRVWGCVSVAIDVCVCILLVFLFLRTKESMFHTKRALMNKLLVLVFETMIPPTVVMLILVSWTSVTGSGLTDFWRVLVWALPNLYFLSILHSLISRRAIKTMIDSRQLSDGIRIVNVQPLSFGNRSRTIEEGAGIFGVLSDAGSVKVEIDTIVHESMPVLNSQSPRRPARPMAASQLPDMAEKGQLHRPSDEPPFNRLPRLELDNPSHNPSLRTSSSDSHKSPKRKPAPPLDSYYWPEVSPEPLKHLKI